MSNELEVFLKQILRRSSLRMCVQRAPPGFGQPVRQVVSNAARLADDLETKPVPKALYQLRVATRVRIDEIMLMVNG